MNCNTNGCEIPETEARLTHAAQKLPTILYVTDPICSACWVMEPAWRKLLLHYGAHFNYQYIYGGLLPKWEGFRDVGAGISQPSDVIPHWEEVAQHYGQPIDPSVWATDPLASSYPPSIALHAVRLFAPEKEGSFLRRMREALFLEARNIAKLDTLISIAEELGLDTGIFTALWKSPTVEAQFHLDLQRTRRLPVRGFPTLLFIDTDEQMTVLHGTRPYHQLEQMVINHFNVAPSDQEFSLDAVLTHYQSGTLPELAEALDIDQEALKAQLSAHPQLELMPVGDRFWWRAEKLAQV